MSSQVQDWVALAIETLDDSDADGYETRKIEGLIKKYSKAEDFDPDTFAPEDFVADVLHELRFVSPSQRELAERRTTINDEDRRQWVDNDEGLYNMYRSSRISMRDFIREHRALIDEVINNVISGAKPAHYGAYERRKSTPKTKKEERQYAHILDSYFAQGYSRADAKSIAAATINRQRAERGLPSARQR